MQIKPKLPGRCAGDMPATQQIPIEDSDAADQHTMRVANLPGSIESLRSNCGVASVWLVCHQAKLAVEHEALIQLCGHNAEVGTFTITLAVALYELGFSVSFHSDADPCIQDVEHLYYKRAKINGIPLKPAQSISDIKVALAEGKKVIALFDTAEGEGHFSPIQSVNPHEILFEYSNEPTLSHDEFEARRRVNGICRQTIVVG